MTSRRIVYIALLLGAVAYYIFNSNYLAWLLLVAVVSFVPLELLLTLPVWWDTRLHLAPVQHTVPRGGAIRMRATVQGRLSISGARAKLRRTNLFTGQTTKQKLKLFPQEEAFEAEFEEDMCGVVEFRLVRPRVLDVAGLFRLPVRHPPRPVQVLVLPGPRVAPPQLPPAGGWKTPQTQEHSGKPGPAALREFTDIREYREGDSVRDIHWKLSAKLDKLIIREAASPQGMALHVAYNYFGEPEEVCLALARLWALSGALWEAERPHEIIACAKPGETKTFFVQNKADIDLYLWQQLARPLPGEGMPATRQLDNLPSPVFVVQPEEIVLYKNNEPQEVLS